VGEVRLHSARVKLVALLELKLLMTQQRPPFGQLKLYAEHRHVCPRLSNASLVSVVADFPLPLIWAQLPLRSCPVIHSFFKLFCTFCIYFLFAPRY
jgi:hypothetical protein